MDAGKIKRNLIRRPVPILLAVWLALWANFTARDLFKKKCMHDYLVLAKKDSEGKRSYVYGGRFYEFLKFAKNIVPPGSGYKFAGLEAASGSEPTLAYRRGVYYLYPLLEKDNPDYIIVYNVKDYNKEGFGLYAGFDDGSFILRRK